MRRPPCPQNDNRGDVDEHRKDDDGGDDDDHHGAVEMNTGESDRANFYLALFGNTTIRYVVASIL